ncbi:MAG: hypothetical protein ACLS9F_13945 [Clostridium paraputrificum]
MNNYMEDLKEREERNGRLVNLIMDYAIENKMSAKDVDKCVEKAKEVFYSDARIIRTAQEVPVQEQSIREFFSQLQILLVTASSIVRKALENTIND